MLTVPADRQIYAVGFLAARFQTSVQNIRQTMESLGIAPAWIINDIDHYDGRAFLELSSELSLRSRANER